MAAEDAPAAPSPDAPSGIEARSLGGPDPASVGLLSPGAGGFGADLWAGSDRATVRHLIERLPTNTASPALRDLMRRLLLTVAEAPEGSDPPGALVAARVWAVLRMGDAGSAVALLGLRDGGRDDEALDRAETEALLLAGEAPRACALAAERAPRHDSPDWHKLLAFCQFLAGEPDKAAFSVSLLREGGHRDAPFFALADALTAGDSTAPADLPDTARPVHLAMARMAGLRLPDILADHPDPGVLRLLAEDDRLDLRVRLDAAEKAEAAGTLTAGRLRELYAEVPFTAADLSGALDDPRRLRGPRGLALLLRAAAARNIPAARAEVLATALDAAATPGRHAQAARLLLPLLDDLEPTGDLAWFVPRAVRAYLVAGEGDRALPWLRMLRGAARTESGSADSLARLMPLARLAGGRLADGWGDGALARWRSLAEVGSDSGPSAPGEAATRQALLFGLLEAIDEPVPESWWLDLLDQPVAIDARMPPTVAWAGMERAAAAGRRGEAALYGLILVGRDGPRALPPLALARLVRALRGAGMDAAARAVAIEAAVAAGL